MFSKEEGKGEDGLLVCGMVPQLYFLWLSFLAVGNAIARSLVLIWEDCYLACGISYPS